MRKTFVNIARMVDERNEKRRKSSARKDAVASNARKGLWTVAAIAALAALAALGFWRLGEASLPDVAKTVAAHPADAEKALELAKKALRSFKNGIDEFDAVCAGVDKMGKGDIKKTLAELKSEPLLEKAQVTRPKLGGDVYYVKIPLDGGGCLNVSVRSQGSGMSLINVSPN